MAKKKSFVSPSTRAAAKEARFRSAQSPSDRRKGESLQKFIKRKKAETVSFGKKKIREAEKRTAQRIRGRR